MCSQTERFASRLCSSFGPDAFGGGGRGLEVGVNGTTLAPRSPILATPYAITVRGIDGHSLDADAGCTGSITLYETTSGWSNRNSESRVVDWVDYAQGDWYDLRDHEDHAGDLNGFSDEAESVRWAIAAGRYGVLYKDENCSGSALLLEGIGSAMNIANLASYGFANEVTSVRFLNRTPNMWVATSSNCPIPGGLGTPVCPYVGSTSMQYAADRIGAPPCFAARTIYIGSGTYNQEVYVDRAMTLSVWNSGPVTIVGP